MLYFKHILYQCVYCTGLRTLTLMKCNTLLMQLNIPAHHLIRKQVFMLHLVHNQFDQLRHFLLLSKNMALISRSAVLHFFLGEERSQEFIFPLFHIVN